MLFRSVDKKTEVILNAASVWERGGPTRSEGSRGILSGAQSSNEIMRNLSVPIFLSKCRAGWSDRKMGTEKWGDMVGEDQRLFPASMRGHGMLRLRSVRRLRPRRNSAQHDSRFSHATGSAGNVPSSEFRVPSSARRRRVIPSCTNKRTDSGTACIG